MRSNGSEILAELIQFTLGGPSLQQITTRFHLNRCQFADPSHHMNGTITHTHWLNSICCQHHCPISTWKPRSQWMGQFPAMKVYLKLSSKMAPFSHPWSIKLASPLPSSSRFWPLFRSGRLPSQCKFNNLANALCPDDKRSLGQLQQSQLQNYALTFSAWWYVTRANILSPPPIWVYYNFSSRNAS